MKFITMVCLVLLAAIARAQGDSVIIFFKYNKTTHRPDNIQTKDSAHAYTRAAYARRDGLWKMENRYVSNGGLYMTGSYSDDELTVKEGAFFTYYENGMMSSEINYTNNKENGLYRSWHANGRLRDSFLMKEGKKTGRGFSWDEDGNILAAYELDELGNGSVKKFNSDKFILESGNLVKGKYDGRWIFNNQKGVREWEVNYSNDSVLSFVCFDTTGRQKTDCILTRDAMPRGGLDEWKIWLEAAIKKRDYPSRKSYRKYTAAELSGKVWVRYLIDTDGSVTDVEVIKSLNPEADQITLDVFRAAPQWEPGIWKGKNIRSYRSQAISFYVTK